MSDAIDLITKQQLNIASDSLNSNDFTQHEKDMDIIQDLTIAKILLKRFKNLM